MRTNALGKNVEREKGNMPVNTDSLNVYEWRTYRMVDTHLPRYLEIVNERLQEIRKDRFGCLLGFWVSAAGGQSEVHHLWEFSSLNARQNLRSLLSKKEDWWSFLNDVAPAIRWQQITFMRRLSNIESPPSPGHLFKMIRYQAAVGKARIVADEILRRPMNKSTTLVALWSAEAPDPNEVIELLAIDTRNACISEIDDQSQTALLLKLSNEIRGYHTTLLSPVRLSPLQ
jgi:PHP family Zn ribbon phosphoesterase